MDLREALSCTTPQSVPPVREVPEAEKHEGWCWKLGGKRANWKKRWFSLLRNRVYYSETHGGPPINFILIDESTVVAPQVEKLHKNARFGFMIKTSYTHRVYYIACEHEDDQKHWIKALTQLVDQAIKQGTAHVNVARHKAPPSLKDRQPVLDVLVKGGEFSSVVPSVVKLRCEVVLKRLTHRTFGIRVSKSANVARWDSDCTFLDPDGLLELRVLADKEVVGIVSLEEDMWTQNSNATTLRIETHGAVTGYVEVKLHFTAANDRSSLLFAKGLPSKVLPFRLDAGDVIIFSSSHLLSYGTKLFTMSRWDHVALVVRWFNDKLRLIEAIDDGVKVFEMDDRLLTVMGAQLAVRRLCVDRTEAMLDRLHAFVGKVRGRPFKKDLLDLARAAGHFSMQEDMSSLFCSQLCAAAYQAMGLLSKSRPTTEFMPRDWASKDTVFTPAPYAPQWQMQRLSKYYVSKTLSPRNSPRSHYTQRPASAVVEPITIPVSVPPRSGHHRMPSIEQSSSSSSSAFSASSASSASSSSSDSSSAPPSFPTYTARSPRGASGTALIGLDRGGSGRREAPPVTVVAPSDPQHELTIEEAKTEVVRRQTMEESKRYKALPDLWAVLSPSDVLYSSTSPLRSTVREASLAPINVSLNV